MKKAVSIVLFFVIISLTCFLFSCQKTGRETQNVGYEDKEYSNNIESIEYYFYEIKNIEKVYFKSKLLGDYDHDRSIGPSSSQVAGFICISEDEKELLMNEYEFEKKEPVFPAGISPDVTGYDKFDWRWNYEFERKIEKGNLAGDMFLDINNGVIFFDVGLN